MGRENALNVQKLGESEEEVLWVPRNVDLVINHPTIDDFWVAQKPRSFISCKQSRGGKVITNERSSRSFQMNFGSEKDSNSCLRRRLSSFSSKMSGNEKIVKSVEMGLCNYARAEYGDYALPLRATLASFRGFGGIHVH